MLCYADKCQDHFYTEVSFSMLFQSRIPELLPTTASHILWNNSCHQGRVFQGVAVGQGKIQSLGVSQTIAWLQHVSSWVPKGRSKRRVDELLQGIFKQHCYRERQCAGLDTMLGKTMVLPDNWARWLGCGNWQFGQRAEQVCSTTFCRERAG